LNPRPHRSPGRPRIFEQDRFWSKVNLAPGCWDWTGCTDQAGYGRFKVNGQSRKAHRVAWEYANGPIEDSTVFACHACDNKKCVRPSHLWLGTNGENQRDYARKFGATNPNPVVRAKVTTAKCSFAQRQWRAGEASAADLGEWLRVAPSTAWHHASAKCKCAERTGH